MLHQHLYNEKKCSLLSLYSNSGLFVTYLCYTRVIKTMHFYLYQIDDSGVYAVYHWRDDNVTNGHM